MYDPSMRACIIIPTCNRPTIVRRAVESSLYQGLKPHEVVVVDDGSEPPDLHGFPPCVKCVKSGRVGLSKARMTGVVNSSLSCEAIGFLDDDDELLPNHVATLLPALEAGAQFAFSRAKYKYKDFETTDPEPNNKGPKRYYDPSALLSQNIAPVSCFMLRKSALEAVGGFDRDVARLEDWDLWGRMQIEFGDPVFKDVVTNVIHKDAGDNMSDANPFAYGLMCRWRDVVEGRLRYLAPQKRGSMSEREKEAFRPPRVSVVMPVYNEERFLRESIESLLRQTYHDFEIIAVNDGSTDGSRDILGSYGNRVKVMDMPERKGVPRCLNSGIMNSIGEYVARMDADDVAHEKRLESQVKFLDNNREVFVVGSRFLSMSEDLKSVVWKNDVPLSHEDIRLGLKQCNCVGHPTVMVRRKLFEKVGGYDETPSSRHAEDYDLWVRAIKKVKFANLEDVLLKHRTHPQQVTRLNEGENGRNAEAIREIARRTL